MIPVTIQVRQLTTFWQKGLGLILAGSKGGWTPVVFRTRLGIHTWFMRQEIDVILLNQDNSINKIRSDLQPWQLWFWGFSAYTVVELPAGFISNLGITPQTRLLLRYVT